MPSKESANHADAAVAVSECYTVGYGVNHDMKSMLNWLHQAASAGSTKATAWYIRLCITVDSSPLPLENAAIYEDCEDRLSGVPVEDYLHARIQQLELVRRIEARLKFEDLFLGDNCLEQWIMELTTFHHLQTDNLKPVHVAAWLGLDSVIETLVALPSQVNLVSKLGRTPIFFACLGGNLSTLRSLINSGGTVDQSDLLGIVPLHLCVFFSRDTVGDAVSLLVEQGADPNAVMNGTLEWEEHDITLQGVPMEWAVRCRHTQLVETLLHTTAEIKGLNAAIELFFWEIVDLLLLQKAWNDEDAPQLALSPIERPYRHWIAQGKDHLHSVSWTLDVLEKHGLDLNRRFAALEESTLLMVMITGSQTIDDFEIIRQLAKRGHNVKFADKNGFTALVYAISRSEHTESWTETLQHLLTYYDTSELEQNYHRDYTESSYLHSAVMGDSLVGARELLGKGVDVNQPTDDSFRYTPLRLCVICDRSPEMVALLLQHGASTQSLDDASKPSLLEERLSGLQRTSKLLDLLLEHHSSKESCLHALHFAINSALMYSDIAGTDTQEAFRHIIAKPAVQSLINCANSGVVTLLHRAAAALNPYLTKLLLEAGADVRISANIKGQALTPLQIALFNGKFCWEAHASKSQGTTELHELSRKAAFDTTCLLLSEHTACKNDAFKGITPLHLAAYMGISHVVEGLIATPGIDKEAKGSWPGQEELLTPVELLAATLIPDAFGYPYAGLFWDVNENFESWSPATREYNPRQQTEGRSRQFRDLQDLQIETGGTSVAHRFLPLKLIYSPRLVYDNASQVARLLGYQLSPSAYKE